MAKVTIIHGRNTDCPLVASGQWDHCLGHEADDTTAPQFDATTNALLERIAKSLEDLVKLKRRGIKS